MTIRTAILAVSMVLLGGCDFQPIAKPESATQAESESTVVQKPRGLVQLIEFHDIQGLRNWAHELDQRRLKALVNVQRNILE